MTRTTSPRYRADLCLTIELGAINDDEADERLAAIRQFIEDRLGKTTFRRLAGQPEILYSTPNDISAV